MSLTAPWGRSRGPLGPGAAAQGFHLSPADARADGDHQRVADEGAEAHVPQAHGAAGGGGGPWRRENGPPRGGVAGSSRLCLILQISMVLGYKSELRTKDAH